MVVTNATKSSWLDIVGVVDLPLRLLGEVFQRYLSVRHIAQLVTHGKTVRIVKSVLCKIIVRNDIIFNKQFRAPTIYRQVLIFVDKFCWFFFQQLQVGVLKIICSKNLIQRNCNRNSRPVNFPCECEFSLKKTYNKYELLRTCFSRILVTGKETNIVQNIVLQNIHFWTKLPLAACGTFLFSKFVCTWLLILHARIQSLKESGVVAMESFSIELIKVIVHKCSKKMCFRNIGGTYKKTP